MQTKFLRHWSIVIALCFTCSALHAQAINKVEYFFDTDPGIGNGTTINLSTPSLTVDSTFTFNVSSLSNGLHMLYVRSQDGLNKWSLNYSGSFIKTNGIDGPLSIVKVEYFIDTDPGYGNAIDLPIQPGNPVLDTFDIQVPDNGADTRYLAVRALDSKGQWSLLYDYNVNMCELYKARPSFSWIRFADQFSFIDSSKINPSHKLLWKFNNLGIDSVSNPQFTFPQGNYFARLIAGEGCRKDSVTLPLFVGLEKYYPDTALAGGDIMMNFYGGGLDTNVVVTLKKGAEIITPYAKVAYQQQFFSGIFDLHTASPGIYDVSLHYANGYDTVITSGLRVAPLPVVSSGARYSPELRLEIFGPGVARANSVVTQRLVITNTGGMVAKSISIWSAAANEADYRPGPCFNDFYKPDNQLNYDLIPTEMGLDSLIGQPYQGKLHSFLIPALNAGESYIYTYTIKVPAIEGEVNVVNFWVGKRMYGSPWEWDCIHAAVDEGFNATGIIPNTGCQLGLGGFGIDFTSGMAGSFGWNNNGGCGNAFGTNKPGSFWYGLASAIWGCIPAATELKAGQIGLETVKVINGVNRVTNIPKAVFDNQNTDNNPCDEENDPASRYRKTIQGRVAADPNGINGPEGYGTNNYITGLGKQGYEVFFENLPTATANAQRIYVADTLDKTKFDLSSFELVGFNLADSFFHIPYQRKEFTTTMDLRPANNLLLRVNAKLDTVSGILNYSFLSLDPATNDTLPLSDLRGFLPPDVNDVNGKGSISYVVNYKKNITTNDVVTNKASIVFDNNAPILTNTWLNTIDRTGPTGSVTGGIKINDTTARISFGGTDVGAGIERYRVYAKKNNRPYFLLGYVFGDTLRFTGTLDSTYSFYAIPYDSLNNFTPKSPVAEYTITFSSPLPVTLLAFDAQKQQKDVLCKWQTTDEMNLSEFIVERSTDGVRYETAGTVMAQNNPGIMNYQFNDQNALTIFGQSKRLYYRLKMVDIDHTSKYSRVAKIDLDKKYTVTVYPNPANKELSIQGLQYYKQLQVIDISGRIVMSEAIKPGMQSINIERLTMGSYILRLSADDDVQSLKFIKN